MRIRQARRALLAAAALVIGFAVTSTGEDVAQSADTLRSASSFQGIDDPAERARALFVEAGKVLTHPRCVNCHPAGDRPHQGETLAAHQPVVNRGTDGFGAVGMRCETCHHAANYDHGRVPGAPHWHLAPIEMAWEGLSLGQICEQIKDPARNGGRDLAAIVSHMEDDPLVAWGWAPGADREPAPGDQTTFAGLIAAWVIAGAACPE